MHPNRFLKQDVLSELFPPDAPSPSGEVTAEALEREDQTGEPMKAIAPSPSAEAVEAVQRPEPMDLAPVATIVAEDGLEPVLGAERKFSTAMALGRVVAIVNQKGGVGKTTSVINLGAALTEEGARVLLVDFDPQGALSVGLGLNPGSLDLTVYNLLLDRDVSFREVVTSTKVEGLDLVPSNIDLAAAEVVLVTEVAREQMLKRCLEPAQSAYNYILIDCPPSLGLLTVNALMAAQAVIIPLECEYFALRGMALLMDTIKKVQERLNPSLEVLGILATMLESRTIHGREVLGRVTDAFGEKLFKTVIHKTIKFAESPVAGEPILSYAPSSNGANEYRELAREVLARDA